MTVFAGLIQRPEPRNMIQTLFLGKLDHDRRAKAGTLPVALAPTKSAVLGAWRAVLAADDAAAPAALACLGLQDQAAAIAAASPVATLPDTPGGGHFWFENPQAEAGPALAARLLLASARAATALAPADDGDRRVIDYAVVTGLGFPAYTGGPLTLARYLGHG
jgi:3-hydroxyacyl-CoA dehydrogenase/enoyl-CoA hydratase/3-hydroxybutyryl-CoA epimerase